MNLTSTTRPISLVQAFIAYCAAVTTATIIYTVFLGAVFSPIEQLLLLLLLEWLVAFFLSGIPYCVAIAIARRYSIFRWWYFLGGGFITAALLCILQANLAREGPPLGPVPDQIPTLIQSYLKFAPSYWTSGVAAGLVCWLLLRRSQSAL